MLINKPGATVEGFYEKSIVSKELVGKNNAVVWHKAVIGKRLGWSRAEDIRNDPVLSLQEIKKENIGCRKIVCILMAYEFAFVLL